MALHTRLRKMIVTLAASLRPRATRKPRVTGGSRIARGKTARSGDCCGCALGANFMGAGLLASAAWYGWQFHSGAASLGGSVVRVLAVAFVAMGVGKIFGILRHRWRGNAARAW
jgi:hypothetical protein